MRAEASTEVRELAKFFADPGDVFRRLRTLEAPALLASGGDHLAARWDIIAAEPDDPRSLQLAGDCDAAQVLSAFTAFQRHHAIREPEPAHGTADTDLPFRGGHIGFLSYELGRRLQGLAPASTGSLPLAAVRYYPWAIVQDRQTQRAFLVSDGATAMDELAARVEALLATEPGPADSFDLARPFEPAWSLAHYRRIFERVKSYIRAGDCYQINIGQPFTAEYRGSLFEAYRQLAALAQAPFSAFLPLGGDNALLSLSPERFLTLDNDRVETRPIKGTRPRFDDEQRDRAAARELLESEKERAENLMIVDLLRNDIGRFCQPGSVAVDALFRLESYATVHHLVSVVSGTLKADCDPLQLLLGCMPGGSITGAPKKRAMEIIDELEPAPRNAWCGSVFYLSRHGRMDSNIAIRSLYSDGGTLTCWAGGGLVDDSRADAEYHEQWHKVGAFLEALAPES